MIKSYHELCQYSTFEDRVHYLMLGSKPGDITFGNDRVINQILYSRDREWKQLRHHIITRDNGCDLGCEDRPIVGEKIIVHHINQLQVNDILEHSDLLFDEDNLISCSMLTHNIIHYGFSDREPIEFKERTPFDTCPWKR